MGADESHIPYTHTNVSRNFHCNLSDISNASYPFIDLSPLEEILIKYPDPIKPMLMISRTQKVWHVYLEICWDLGNIQIEFVIMMFNSKGNPATVQVSVVEKAFRLLG